jgi:glycosyltransferase involved in cell wall biosynthesis
MITAGLPAGCGARREDPHVNPVVLHVLESLEGGTARHVADVTRFVDGFAHEVVVPPRRTGGVTDEIAPVTMRDAGAVVHVIDMRRTPAHPVNALALARIRRLIADRQPAVVHAHSSIGGVVGRLAAVARPVARVYTAHAVAPGRGPVLIERALGRLTDRWIAVSESEAALARREGLVRADRLVVIPNGINLSAVERPAGPSLRTLAGVPADVPLVGSVARLTRQKSPVDFVRLAAAVARTRPDAWFVLIGSGSLHDEVVSVAQTLGIASRFRQLDAVIGVGTMLGELDVFVLTSRFEGAPYTPLEAMRAGVPVVLTDVVGNRDIVEDGRSGYLRPFGDIDGLASAVTGILTDRATREAVTRAAHERLVERFDVRTMASALGEVYASVARR